MYVSHQKVPEVFAGFSLGGTEETLICSSRVRRVILRRASGEPADVLKFSMGAPRETPGEPRDFLRFSLGAVWWGHMVNIMFRCAETHGQDYVVV